MKTNFKDNSSAVLSAVEQAIDNALNRIGSQAEGYAKDLAPVGTGLLRNSITYAISGKERNIKTYKADKGDGSGTYTGTAPEEKDGVAVYVGTNVEYAIYQELGTIRIRPKRFLTKAAT